MLLKNKLVCLSLASFFAPARPLVKRDFVNSFIINISFVTDVLK